MLDIRIRLVSYIANHPACYASIRYFMEAWRINAGKYSTCIRFTLLLPKEPSEECLAISKELAARYPLDFYTVTEEINSIYRVYWPISYINNAFDDDVIIYSSPDTFIASDISNLIERSFLSRVLIASKFYLEDVAVPWNRSFEKQFCSDFLLGQYFICYPASVQSNLKYFPNVLNRLAFPLKDEPSYYQVMALLATAFTETVVSEKIIYEYIEVGDLFELESKSKAQPKNSDYDSVKLFVVTDDARNKYTWSSIFNNKYTIQSFIDDTDLTGEWLYFQRNFRKLHVVLENTYREINFFQTLRSPYYIYAYGFDFVQRSAGMRALHFLCHALNELGAEAYLVGASYESLHLRTPMLKESDLQRHKAIKADPIVVYPEVIHGNPLNLNHVVRWVLNTPGLLGGDKEYHDSEILYAYGNEYIPDGMSMELLTIPVVDNSIFNNLDNLNDQQRKGCCYYANKYFLSGGKLTEHVNGAKSLCQNVKLSPIEMAGILRSSELLYCYEPSAIMGEALACGCPVVIIPTPYLIDSLGKLQKSPGVALTTSEMDIENAKNSIGEIPVIHRKFTNHCWELLENFIKNTQSIVKGRQKSLVDPGCNWFEPVKALVDRGIERRNTLQNPKMITISGKGNRNTSSENVKDAYEIWREKRVHWAKTAKYWLDLNSNADSLPTIHLIMKLAEKDVELLADTIDSLCRWRV